MGPIELGQEAVQGVLLLLLLQTADQLGRREEADSQAGSTGRQAKSNRNMCLDSTIVVLP